MRRFVMPRLVAAIVTSATVLVFGYAVSQDADARDGEAAAAYFKARDRGWCC